MEFPVRVRVRVERVENVLAMTFCKSVRGDNLSHAH